MILRPRATDLLRTSGLLLVGTSLYLAVPAVSAQDDANQSSQNIPQPAAPTAQGGAADRAAHPIGEVSEQVTVTATRSSLDLGPNDRTISALTATELQQYAALTLDERLRQHAGFELFRRSSGWVQNPTSQGISLRGLGSTAASRTLVLADSAPLNDPFGGWIHWNELPPEAIDAVTIASGGGSDLYGSSALGGVINLVTAHPVAPLAALTLSEAGEDTSSASGRGDLRQSHWGELAAAQIFRTDGYILTAPAQRGPVDIPADVHFETGRVELDRDLGTKPGRVFLVGNLLNEARDNGTLAQTNGTRIWRYLSGDDWTAGSRFSGRVRLFGSDEAYRQTFSSINAARTVENLTRVQHDETQELGASTDASVHFTHVAFITGFDARDIRAGDNETPITSGKPNGLSDTTARQRFLGGFGEALAEHGGWSGTASLRADSAQNLDTSTITVTGAGASTQALLPNRSEIVLSPRVGLSRRLGSQATLHATGFRAFRAPTMNELYRTGQVGSETTLANSGLVSERATGAEAGVEWTPKADMLRLDATYFWTGINRPVSAVEISSTATTITEKRENLGQIQSQGLELSARIRDGHAISAAFGYQYAHAVVTAFSAQPSLIGNWIPDVGREMATAQIRAQNRRFGEVTIAARNSGRAFDDSGNTFVLHSYFLLDVFGEREFARHWTAFFAAQNVLNRPVDVARTPVLTQGTPFTAQGGVKFRWRGVAAQ
jgi:outer membrane receptor protein involved in Fe transport